MDREYHNRICSKSFKGNFYADSIYFLAVEKRCSYGTEERFALLLTHDQDVRKVMYFDHERRPAGKLPVFVNARQLFIDKQMKVFAATELPRGPSINGISRNRKFVFLELYVKTEDFVWKSLTAQASEEMRKIQTQGNSARGYLWLTYVCAKYYRILHPELKSFKYEDSLAKRSFFVFCAFKALKVGIDEKGLVKFYVCENPRALSEYNGFFPSAIRYMESHPGSTSSNAELVPRPSPIPKYTQNKAGEGAASKLKQAVTKVKTAIPSRSDQNPGLADSIALSSQYMSWQMKVIQEQEQAEAANTVQVASTPASAVPVQATASSSGTNNNTGTRTNNHSQNTSHRSRNVTTTNVVRKNQR